MRRWLGLGLLAFAGCIRNIDTAPVGKVGVAHRVSLALMRGEATLGEGGDRVCLSLPEGVTHGDVKEERGAGEAKTSSVMTAYPEATTAKNEEDEAGRSWQCYHSAVATYAAEETANIVFEAVANVPGAYLFDVATMLDAEVSIRVAFDVLPDATAGLDVHPSVVANNEGGAAVAYGAAGFVSLDFGAATVRISSDGETWPTTATVAADASPTDLVFGNGVYVITGNAGALWTSADALTWTPAVSGVAGDLMTVTHGGGRFVAVGDAGATTTSTDGVNWTPALAGSDDLFAVAYVNGRFATQSSSGLYTSADGVAWVPATTPPESVYLRGATSTVFVATLSDVLYTSPDGMTWTSAGTAHGATKIVELRGRLYGIGANGLVTLGASGIVIGKPTSSPMFAIATDGKRLVLTGLGSDITVKLPKGELDLGDLSLDDVPKGAAASVNLTNVGEDVLYVGAASITGDARLTIVTDDCAGKELAVDAACAITVKMSDGDGLAEAQLLVPTSGAEEPLMLPVHGTTGKLTGEGENQDGSGAEGDDGCAAARPGGFVIVLVAYLMWRHRRTLE